MATAGGRFTVVSRRDEARDPMLPVILEFQWPSSAIANAPIPRSARGVVWVVSSMVVAMITVMGLIPVDQVVTATGIIVAVSPTLVVQPLDTAIVRSIEVREGDRVSKGQVLARLDPTLAAADQGAISARVASLEAEVLRLEAEAAGKDFTYAGLDPNMSLQAAIFAHRQAEFELRIENYRHKTEELKAMIARADADSVGYRSRLDVAQNVESMRKELEARQVGSRLSTLAAVDTRAEMGRAVASALQTAEAAKRDLSAMTAEHEGYVQAWRADVSEKLAESSRDLSDAQELLTKAKLHRDLIELRAEADATVLSIAKVSPGAVMQSGQQFFALVPIDAPLEAEANISGRQNGLVHLGDPVVLKFDTFPFSQYGMAKGTVRTLSPSSFTPQEEDRNPTSAVPMTSAAFEPYYRARVSLDKVELRNVRPDFHLIPGMPVTADIKVGKRTVLSYLLGRVLPVAQEGMREP